MNIKNLTPQQKWVLKNSKKCLSCEKIVGPTSNRCNKCAANFRDNSYAVKNLKTFHNEDHPRWKGDDVGYIALHDWIRVNKPKPEFCEICNINKPKDLANLSGEYRRDLNDFKYMCRSCHRKFDYKDIPRDSKGKFIRK